MKPILIVGHIGDTAIGAAVAKLYGMGHEDVQVITPEQAKELGHPSSPFEPEPMEFKAPELIEYTSLVEYKTGQELRRERRKKNRKK